MPRGTAGYQLQGGALLLRGAFQGCMYPFLWLPSGVYRGDWVFNGPPIGMGPALFHASHTAYTALANLREKVTTTTSCSVVKMQNAPT